MTAYGLLLSPTGQVQASHALGMGLASTVVPCEELEAPTASKMLQTPLMARAAVKRAIIDRYRVMNDRYCVINDRYRDMIEFTFQAGTRSCEVLRGFAASIEKPQPLWETWAPGSEPASVRHG